MKRTIFFKKSLKKEGSISRYLVFFKKSMARSHKNALHLSLLLYAGFTSAFTLQNTPFIFSKQFSLQTVASCKQGSLFQKCRHAPLPAALSRSARKSSESMSSALPSSDSAIPSSDKLVLSGSTPMAGCVVNLIKNIVSSSHVMPDLLLLGEHVSHINLIRLDLVFCV
jgi:hypothetical protein